MKPSAGTTNDAAIIARMKAMESKATNKVPLQNTAMVAAELKQAEAEAGRIAAIIARLKKLGGKT